MPHFCKCGSKDCPGDEALCQCCVRPVCGGKTTWVDGKGNVCDRCLGRYLSSLFDDNGARQIYDDACDYGVVIDRSGEFEKHEKFRATIRKLVGEKHYFKKTSQGEWGMTWKHVRTGVEISYCVDRRKKIEFLSVGVDR